MFAFALAIAGASLMGSLHCVGMCGPFALWAMGSDRRGSVVSGYHLGRLTTYLSAGLLAGLIGSTITITGEVAGYQSLAAKLAGGMLVVVGTVQIVRRTRWWGRLRRTDVAGPKRSRIAGWLQLAKPIIQSRGPIGRAYLGGLLTTWLPCGWLYLFVLVAGSTGDVIAALIVMSAFWIGTLPALTGLMYGAGALAGRFRWAVPTATSLLLIGAGLYTVSGRASADLTLMKPGTVAKTAGGTVDVNRISELVDEPLPCCEGQVEGPPQ